ncbi:hypothetical protein FFK22_001605 [Mycobacterium sp. KBS0706]|uniref:hypothetical protein n=1 Tax=Mycobacterium sp. KBS0706 TaxID=2578109 RepID=UPI00110FC7F2|nr:hypothetical protein [Mycobacterium sp. KBS0706]TSD90539.1 hypothetical protein FFK22_001605 [Mycobacterium sp. KBS0706]
MRHAAGPASEIFFATSGSSVNYPVTIPALRQGQSAFISFDIREADADKIDAVTVTLQGAGGEVHWQRTYKGYESWDRHTIPFSPVAGFYKPIAMNLVFSPSALDYKDDDNCRIRIGRLRVHAGKNPVDIGHLRSTGDMTWNGSHIVFGNGMTREVHIWLDGSGALRVKPGRPTTDTDGRALQFAP